MPAIYQTTYLLSFFLPSTQSHLFNHLDSTKDYRQLVLGHQTTGKPTRHQIHLLRLHGLKYVSLPFTLFLPDFCFHLARLYVSSIHPVPN